MKFPGHASAILLGLGIVAAAGSSAAWSQEELVMPFACDARGGGVRLAPAPEQAYRIYGNREKWLFRYCSPNAPDRCHHWMLHQFDVDCGGIRVPWIRVAEASAPDGRAWVEDGRMTLKLGAAEASPREESMARRRWWWRQRGAYPADDRDRFDGPNGTHSEMVELPAGFAPVLGTRAQFVGAPPAEMSSGPMDRNSQMAAVAAAKPPAAAAQKRETSPGAPPKEPTAQVSKEPAAQVSKEPAAQAIKVPAPAPAKREPAKTVVPAQASEPGAQKAEKTVAAPVKDEKAATTPLPKASDAPGGTSVTPTIINKPAEQGTHAVDNLAAGSSIAEKKGEIREAAAQADAGANESPAPSAEAPSQVAEAAEQEASPAPSPIATGSLQDQSSSAATGDVSHARNLTIGFVLFGVLAASSFVFWSRRQEHARFRTMRRDIASVSFGGAAPSHGLPAPFAPHPAPAQDSPADVAQAPFSGAGFEVPSTPQEALQVLGASPDASTDVIKKIVDGLRQSWHPDLAKSEDDRLYREQRVKQINVAWDILSGRRNAA